MKTLGNEPIDPDPFATDGVLLGRRVGVADRGPYTGVHETARHSNLRN